MDSLSLDEKQIVTEFISGGDASQLVKTLAIGNNDMEDCAYVMSQEVAVYCIDKEFPYDAWLDLMESVNCRKQAEDAFRKYKSIKAGVNENDIES